LKGFCRRHYGSYRYGRLDESGNRAKRACPFCKKTFTPKPRQQGEWCADCREFVRKYREKEAAVERFNRDPDAARAKARAIYWNRIEHYREASRMRVRKHREKKKLEELKKERRKLERKKRGSSKR